MEYMDEAYIKQLELQNENLKKLLADTEIELGNWKPWWTQHSTSSWSYRALNIFGGVDYIASRKRFKAYTMGVNDTEYFDTVEEAKAWIEKQTLLRTRNARQRYER